MTAVRDREGAILAEMRVVRAMYEAYTVLVCSGGRGGGLTESEERGGRAEERWRG